MSESDGHLSELPDGWVWLTVRSAITKVALAGRKLKQKNYEGAGRLPVIDQGLSFIGGYTSDEELKVECQLPVVIFGDHTKVFKFVDFDFVAGADGIKVIRPQEMYYPKLFYYFVQATSLPEKGYARHFQFLEKAQIPLPPLPEQHRIVAKIEERFTKLDAGIDALHKVQAQLKRYRQSVLKAAFDGKLTEAWRAEHQDEIEPVSPDASDLPDGWVWTNLEDVSELNPRIDKQSIDDDLEITFLPMKCVEELTGKIDLSEAKQFSEVKRKSYTPFRDGDILFAKVTPCMENGKIAIAHDLKNGIGFGSTEFHVVRSLEEQSTQFFFFYFIQQKFRQDAKRAMTSAVGLLRVPTDYMRKVLIALPALAEQQAIVSEVGRRLSVADEVEKTVAAELKRAEQLRQSILKQAFSGGLVPQDSNDEPASVLLERIREEKS